jgi:hypothetical protein
MDKMPMGPALENPLSHTIKKEHPIQSKFLIVHLQLIFNSMALELFLLMIKA